MGPATLPTGFRAGQILSRSWPHWLLLAEVIEVIPHRQRLWLRPLCLGYYADHRLAEVWDLREDSHLLWPNQDFEVALDVDALELLTRLPAIASTSLDGQAQLRRLI
jgi:hypothetical protein